MSLRTAAAALRRGAGVLPALRGPGVAALLTGRRTRILPAARRRARPRGRLAAVKSGGWRRDLFFRNALRRLRLCAVTGHMPFLPAVKAAHVAWRLLRFADLGAQAHAAQILAVDLVDKALHLVGSVEL